MTLKEKFKNIVQFNLLIILQNKEYNSMNGFELINKNKKINVWIR